MRDVVRQSWSSRWRRFLLRRAFAGLGDTPWRLCYWDGTSDVFGEGEPRFRITLHKPGLLWGALFAPDPVLGDAYVAGTLEAEPLDAALEVFHRVRLSPLAGLRLPEWGGLRGTPVSRQYREVQAHYDRGNAFFALWLDESRTYSCAYFRRPTDSLEAAQAAKIEHVLRKACLRPGDTLLDIGSGWGALILAAARRHGVRAHGITLSREQYEFTRQAIREQGLEERASVELLDYRELAGRRPRFDRVVSVGMLEHVGKRNLGVFLGAVRRLLREGGVCVLHSITRMGEGPCSPWMRRHIFPGGYIPSWREVVRLLPEHGFYLVDVESLRRHYALTLDHWARRFEARLPEVRALGFDEAFIRMWRLYLRGAAAAFRAGTLDLHQFVFTRGPSDELPMTREPLYAPAPTDA